MQSGMSAGKQQAIDRLFQFIRESSEQPDAALAQQFKAKANIASDINDDQDSSAPILVQSFNTDAIDRIRKGESYDFTIKNDLPGVLYSAIDPCGGAGRCDTILTVALLHDQVVIVNMQRCLSSCHSESDVSIQAYFKGFQAHPLYSRCQHDVVIQSNFGYQHALHLKELVELVAPGTIFRFFLQTFANRLQHLKRLIQCPLHMAAQFVGDVQLRGTLADQMSKTIQVDGIFQPQKDDDLIESLSMAVMAGSAPHITRTCDCQ
jgi:hypothetical protein